MSIDTKSLKIGDRVNLTIAISGLPPVKRTATVVDTQAVEAPIVYLDEMFSGGGYSSYASPHETKRVESIKKLGLDPSQINLWHGSNGDTTYDSLVDAVPDPRVRKSLDPLTFCAGDKVKLTITIGGKSTQATGTMIGQLWDKRSPIVYLDDQYHGTDYSSFSGWGDHLSAMRNLGLDTSKSHLFYDSTGSQITWDEVIAADAVDVEANIDPKTLKPGDRIRFIRNGKLCDGVMLTPDYCGISWMAEDKGVADYTTCTPLGKWKDQNATKWADEIGLVDQTKIGFTAIYSSIRIVSVEPKAEQPEIPFADVKPGDRISYWTGSDKSTVRTAVVLSNKQHAYYTGDVHLAYDGAAPDAKKWDVDGASTPGIEWAKHCGLDTSKFRFQSCDEKTLHITSHTSVASIGKPNIGLGDYVRLRYKDGVVKDGVCIGQTSDSLAFAELGKDGRQIESASELGRNAAALGVSANDYTFFWQDKSSEYEVIGYTRQSIDIKKLKQGDRIKILRNGVISDGIVIDPNGYSSAGRYYAEAKATATHEKNSSIPNSWENNTANKWALEQGIDRNAMGYSYTASACKVLSFEPKPLPIDQDTLEVGDEIEIEIDRNGTKIYRVATVVATAKDERAHYNNDSEAGVILHSEAPDEESGSFQPLAHWKPNALKMLLPEGYPLGWRLYKSGRNATKVVKKIGKRPLEGNVQPDLSYKVVAGDRVECYISPYKGERTIATGTVIGKYGDRAIVFDSPLFENDRYSSQTLARLQAEGAEFGLKVSSTNTCGYGFRTRLRVLSEKAAPLPKPEPKPLEYKEAIDILTKAQDTSIVAAAKCVLKAAAEYEAKEVALIKREEDLAKCARDVQRDLAELAAKIKEAKEVEVEAQAEQAPPDASIAGEFVSVSDDSIVKQPSGTRVQVMLEGHIHTGTILYTESEPVRMLALDEDCVKCCDPSGSWEESHKKSIQEEGSKFGVKVDEANTHNLSIFGQAKLLLKEEPVEVDPSKGVQAMMVAGTAIGALISAMLRPSATPSVRVEMPEIDTVIDEVASEVLTQNA